ncbi:MAG: AraC family transcriptional regulator [Rhodanobacteraceae bacterium]|jgi:AraC-like DNA-binding protein|uniref:AraC family transcriptional regulator n=1 Tax=Luteimonas huabeiensis TaxID=1244513 RepID=UPI0004655703|nr:AraC family transcriptional regulator [Luteimonas huabeiensis]NCT67260.1 AraC family transcriptional regulator [Rhodanobacteraceae bacterium]
MGISYQVRIACLTGFEEEVATLGGDPATLLDEVGLSLAALHEGDCLVDLSRVIRVLDNAARQLECADFGMRVASHQGIVMLGLLGKLLASEPNLGAAFVTTQHFITLHHTAEHWRMQCHGKQAHIRLIEHFHAPALRAQQHREMALATFARLAQELGGPGVWPLRVEISHSPVAPLKVYQRHFGCEVLFDQEQDCLVYDEKWLACPVQPVSRADDECIDAYLREHLARCRDSLELQVRSLILQTIGARRHSLPHIAALLEMHPRTLQRRLQDEHLNFKQLLNEVKMQTACWHLQASSIDITRLSGMLGYRNLAAFSKAFREYHGTSPLQWKRLHATRTEQSHAHRPTKADSDARK